jgi:hypothetical protein
MLSILSEEAPPLERGSGFEFAVPKGWTRQPEEAPKTTVLVPRDAKGEVRLILYPPYAVSNGTYSNEAHFHIAMLQALTEAGEKQGEPTTGKTGAFQWSRVKFTVQGNELRLAAYTARLRSNWGLVAFAAPPEAFETHIATVEQFVRDLKYEEQGKSVAAGAQEIHGLVIPLPEGWSRKDNPEGAIELHPPAPRTERDPEWSYVMLVLPTQPLRGTLWETQRAIFEEVVKGSGLRNTVAPLHEPDAPGPFIRSSTAGDDVNGSVHPVRLYSALSEGGIECVVVYRREDSLTTGPMLDASKVRKPSKDAPRAKIVGAYRRLSQQTHVEYHRGQQLIIAVPYDRIWLRSDGLADFSPIYREGYAASRIPAKLEPVIQNGRYGSWKAVGEKEVHIVRRSDKPPEVYLREGGNLRLGDKVYEPMPSVDGLVLEGRWHLPGADRKRRIEFTKAGRFKDDGLLEDVGYLPVPRWSGSAEVLYPRPPAAGEGTYEIRDFTILLKYDDGRPWSADFSIEGNDPKDLSRLLMKTGTLHRETP